MRARSAGWVAAATALVLIASACGSDKKDDTSGSAKTAKTTTTASASSQNDDLLGKVNSATGEPVLVGMISNGVTSGIDNQIELDVADIEVRWLNERKGGIGGRPIKLVTCTDQADPGKASDCATNLVRQNVAAVVIGSSAVIEAEWRPLHDAHIPVVAFGATGKLLKDPDSTFGVGSAPSSLLITPIQAAKDQKAKKITAMVIDVPAATAQYEAAGPGLEKQEGIKLDLVRIPIGTPDMTPQANQIISKGDPGVLNVLGNDSFCIAAFNALRAVGFKGTVTTAAPCITDATRKAVPGDFLSGMLLSYSAPVGDQANVGYKLYKAVLDTYTNGKTVDLSRTQGWGIFMALSGLNTAVEGISGEITPATIISTIKKMPLKELPGAGGLHFRCNGKADPANPAVCLTGTLVSKLDAQGQPTTYDKANDVPIPD